MNEIRLTIHPFEMGMEKESAIKVLKEAAEVYAAWQEIDGCGSFNQCMNCEVCESCESPLILADEIADTIQASSNLAARYGVDLQAAMERREQRNRARGRYPMEEVNDAKAAGTCGSDVCDCGGDCGAVSLGVDDLPKSPEEMNTEELIEALSRVLGYGFSCRKLIADAWCKTNGCVSCVRNLFSLLKAAHERKAEEAIELIKDGRDEYMRLRTENGIMLDEILIRQDRLDGLNQQVSDLTNERDGLRRRLEELSDAGITELHRLLRETVGDAKNVTDSARHYVENAREKRKPNPEREAVIKRPRELEFAHVNGSHASLSDIAFAVMGEHAVPWSAEHCKALRDKLVTLIDGGAE